MRPRRRDAQRSPAAGQPQRSVRYRNLLNPFAPVRVFSDDQIESMHLAALGIIERQGMRVLSRRGRALLAEAGASVDEASQMVRLDPAMVGRALATVPAEVTLIGRDPARSCRVGGHHVVFAPVAGPPSVSDLERGKRTGSIADFRDFVRLSQAFDVMHVCAQTTEPQDVPVNERHLDTALAQLTLADKAPNFYSRGDAQLADCFAMLRIAHGIDEATFRAAPRCYSICNTNSPLQLDVPMTDGIMEFALNGQLMIVTPFTLAGAMAPVTIPGALTLAHAEALFGITLSQTTRPGAPVMYGSFTSNVDMKSGSPAFGTPEYAKAAFGAGQLARRIGVPWRCSSATASNAPDAQAAYEAQMSLWGALLGGSNFILHAAGWLEGGLTASFEKFILDVEMLQMFAELFQPVAATAEEIGIDAVAEVGPGGHFFAAAHTMQRYRDAFYSPLISDWRNYGAWVEGGSKSATERAAGVWRQTLAAFQPPPMDVAAEEELTAFVDRRRREGGAAPAG
ncbi:MAG: trimethylamine methyltransferase family protein [Gammaproteobacteria bacterium]|nr:trimethylamine methyltransferase family protein [Gammaproteobacteria bacterium]MBV9723879.1 trimethylamine methyltransferase family protein [Gammaproteobacteria bacterium]